MRDVSYLIILVLTTQGYNIQYLNFSQNHELRQKYRQSDYD